MKHPWPETQKLITAALERPEDDRERFVRDNCSDAALSETITALFNLGDTAAATAHRASPADDTPALLTGHHVGPYVVLRRLGRGGMGEVFLARDGRLERAVALKCLLPSSGGPDLRERVVREARAAARITHPNVAAVYDVIEDGGRAFIVMEYVEGESLSAVISRGPLPARRTIEFGRQLAAALAAAHAGGIVHRDLKPANIQVTTDGSVKILDFGIAKAFASVSSSTTRTEFGIVTEIPGLQVGTPAYMSPEQLLGGVVDERSDLFSLAVILFEMATGRRPVPSGRPLEMIVAAARTLPRADAVADGVPPQLADVIEKGLAANPDDRFQSGADLAAALEGVRVELFPTGSGTRVFVARRSWGRRLAVPAAIIASLPLVFWLLGWVMSEAYNITLERTGEFANEPALAYIELGRRSVVAPIVYATLAAATMWVARFLLRLLTLSGTAARAVDGVAVRFARVASRLSLDEPVVLAQGLATLGVAALGIIVWRFNGLIGAWGATISTADPAQLWPLSPDNETEKVLYRAVLTVLFLVFAAGLLRVVNLRRRQTTRGGQGGFAALVAIVVILGALNEVPYRIMWQSKAARVTYAGQRCYVIGEAGTRRLLYCPENAPPRNRQVDVNDPELKPTGVVEEIFSTAPRAR